MLSSSFDLFGFLYESKSVGIIVGSLQNKNSTVISP